MDVLKNKRPFVLSIAGLDPSGGAGLLADIKTSEALNCQGLAVCSANTIQNDISFKACNWISFETMKSQIDLLFERFSIDFVKIGIVKDWQVLHRLIALLLHHNSSIKIILDPVLTASSNFDFHKNKMASENDFLDRLLDKIYLLTPNYNEIKDLYPLKNMDETRHYISQKTNLLLKGGHKKEFLGEDVLFTKEGCCFNIAPKNKNCSEKHGSGCVLSMAIASFLALGCTLNEACEKGKYYTEKVLASNKSLLGYHG